MTSVAPAPRLARLRLVGTGPLPAFGDICARAGAFIAYQPPVDRLLAMLAGDAQLADDPDHALSLRALIARVEELAEVLAALVPIVPLLEASGDMTGAAVDLETHAIKLAHAFGPVLGADGPAIFRLVVAADMKSKGWLCGACGAGGEAVPMPRYAMRSTLEKKGRVYCARCWELDLDALGMSAEWGRPRRRSVARSVAREPAENTTTPLTRALRTPRHPALPLPDHDEDHDDAIPEGPSSTRGAP